MSTEVETEQPIEAQATPADLGDILPENSKFTLKTTGKTYDLRPVDLDDHVWIKNHMGGMEGLEKMFADGDVEKITKLTYHQMTQETRKHFLAREEGEHVDSEGVLTPSRMVTGPEVFRKAVMGPAEMADVIKALLKTLGISEPVLDQLEVAELKKKEEIKAARIGDTVVTA